MNFKEYNANKCLCLAIFAIMFCWKRREQVVSRWPHTFLWSAPIPRSLCDAVLTWTHIVTDLMKHWKKLRMTYSDSNSCVMLPRIPKASHLKYALSANRLAWSKNGRANSGHECFPQLWRKQPPVRQGFWFDGCYPVRMPHPMYYHRPDILGQAWEWAGLAVCVYGSVCVWMLSAFSDYVLENLQNTSKSLLLKYNRTIVSWANTSTVVSDYYLNQVQLSSVTNGPLSPWYRLVFSGRGSEGKSNEDTFGNTEAWQATVIQVNLSFTHDRNALLRILIEYSLLSGRKSFDTFAF